MGKLSSLFSVSDEAHDTFRAVADDGTEIIIEGEKQAGSTLRSSTRSAMGSVLGTGGLFTTGWLGTTYLDNRTEQQKAEAKEQAAKSYEEAVREIQNDPSLSPEQKMDALSELSDYYTNLGGGGGGGSIMDKLGFTGLLVLAVLLLGAMKYGAEMYQNRA